MSKLKVSPEEYVEVHNLYSAYNLASDMGDAEGYADCFHKDGEHHGTQDLYGYDELVKYKKEEFAKRAHLYRRHWNGSIHLEKVAEDTIRGRCYLFGYNGEPGQDGKPGKLPYTTHAGVYTDTITRVDGVWKYQHRKIHFDGVASS